MTTKGSVGSWIGSWDRKEVGETEKHRRNNISGQLEKFE